MPVSSGIDLEEVSSYFEEIADNFSNRLEGYSVQYQELSVDAETSKDGQCPKLSDNVTCANTLYAKNECWSIGQPDTDCENQALCCFNGELHVITTTVHS